ncbi:hypothetical protein HDU79_009423 [Rhizoclosmatium sp. JEL0117]|nr:hypothetical protein HDU79_009423 [Rhizoclosmatium sp. JEL0117]
MYVSADKFVETIEVGIEELADGLIRAKEVALNSQPTLVQRLSSASLNSSRSSVTSISTSSEYLQFDKKPAAKLDLEPLFLFQEERRLNKLNRRMKLNGGSLDVLDASVGKVGGDVNFNNEFVTNLDTHDIEPSLLLPLSLSTHSSHLDSELLSLIPPDSIKHQNYLEDATHLTILEKSTLFPSTSSTISSIPPTSQTSTATTESSENTREDLFYTTAQNENIPPPQKYIHASKHHDPNTHREYPFGNSRQPDYMTPITNLDDLESHALLPISAETVHSEPIASSKEDTTSSGDGSSLHTDAVNLTPVMHSSAASKRSVVLDDESFVDLDEAAILVHEHALNSSLSRVSEEDSLLKAPSFEERGVQHVTRLHLVESETLKTCTDVEARALANAQWGAFKSNESTCIYISNMVSTSVETDDVPVAGGELTVWMVGSEAVQLPTEEHGIFYSGECYLLLSKRETGNTVFLWVGDDSNKTDLGALVHSSSSGGTGQVRVKQGHETMRFLALFNSDESNIQPLIIRRGCRSPLNSLAKTLYVISGQSAQKVRAVQVAWNIANFNSSAVILAVTEDGGGILWVGDGAHGFEREAGLKVASRLCSEKAVKEIQELCEPPGFWTQFGLGVDQSARAMYASVPYLMQKAKYTSDFQRRLWKLKSGESIEMSPYTQQDLQEDGIYLLDAFFEIFVWVGRAVKHSYKDIHNALTTSLDYAKHVQKIQPVRLEYEKSRDELRVWMIRDGHETLEFKSCFVAFDDAVKDLGSEYSFRYFNSLLEASRNRYPGRPRAEYAKGVIERIERGIYSVDALRDKERLPVGVDIENLERHLADEEFLRLFKTDIETFNGYPSWKQVEMKKKAGLF